MRRLIAILAVAALAAACGQKTSTTGAAPPPAGGAQLSGAGATFPAPLYAKWAEAQKAAALGATTLPALLRIFTGARLFLRA